MKSIIIISTCWLGVGLLTGCTKLDEKLNAELTQEEAIEIADISGLLKGCYTSFRGPFQDQTGVFALQDMSSDDCIGPTRGGDWDDNGVWRVLHTHTWDADNQRIRENFSGLLQIVFNTTNLLNFSPPAGPAAEAYALRAYAMFYVLDLYNQVPVREPGGNLLLDPDVFVGTDALGKIIEDLEKAEPDLSETAPPTQATKWMVKTMLAKAYLNKGVYANRLAPTFETADLDKVIQYCDQIINSGRFSLEDDYFKSFTSANSETSREIIFSNKNEIGDGGNVRFHYYCGTHYNQTPSGWNGFTTLANFYDKFEAVDQRVGRAYPGFTNVTGMRVGFLIGQQYDQNNAPLKDRSGNNLVFTRDISPVISGQVETPGIRVVKYVPNMVDDAGGSANNDYVLLRYSDVLLMKAEALFRKGETDEALDIVNDLRDKRGATELASLTADNLLDERGREFYWESWRRHDMIRFGKFLAPYGPTKPGTSDNKYVIFPIPSNALAVNPNLTQNPGY